MNTTELKDFAQLAQAAYANFDEATFFFRGGRPADLNPKLRTPNRGDFTTQEAADFSARYNVLHQYTDNTSSVGFSATLFQDRSTGRLVFSIRGTEFQGDLIRDLLVTDLRIGIDGYASPQVIPLYRHFKQLTVGAGQAVTYTAAEIANLEAVYFDMFEDNAPRRAQWEALRSSLQADVGVDAGQGSGVALIGAGQSVDVAGHSLGGHLALLMDRLFPDRVDQVVTLNAPGFFPQSTSILDRFSPGWNGGSILRIEASGDAVSEIGTSYPGTRMLIAQENEAAINIGVNHSSVNGVDGLVLTELIGRLDSRFAADPRVCKAMIDAGSDEPIASYETLLDGFRALLIGPDQAKTPLNTDRQPAGREGFYDNMTSLAASSSFTALAGKVRVDLSSRDLSDKARNDFAALASLISLSPVALTATDGNQGVLNSALQSAWGQIYTDWQTDRDMSPVDRQAGRGTFTDRWIADRADMLDTLVRANQSNEGFYNDRSVKDVWVYEDKGSDTLVLRQPGGPGPFTQHQISFGGTAADTLAGAGAEDHLYGGAGDDTLNGLGGADYLEGNADNDTLDGGEGNDTLLGGTGYDTYVFTGAWGADTVIDADGSGAIQVEGLGTLDGADAEKAADGVWQTDDRRVNYSLVALDASRDDLIVSFSDRTDIIRIRNWTSGALGITLSDTPFVPATVDTFTGDIIKATSGNDYLTTPNGYSSAGAQADAPDVLNGGSAGDLLQGLGGNDGISGGAGDDVIEGGDGADLLLGGAGADTIDGGAGNDFIFGSASGQIDRPDRVDFTPPGSTGTELARGFSWVAYAPAGDDAIVIAGTSGIAPNGESTGNVIDGGAGDDRIYAGSGADIVHGGDDDDHLNGLGGADVLYGDAGDDTVFGDGKQAANAGGAYTPSAEHGNDILVGGAGNDTLSGQGGDDEQYGGSEDDPLFGDDIDLIDTPVVIHGNDWLDGGDGVDFLHGGGRDDVLYGGAGNDSLWGDAGKGVGQPGYIDGAYQGDDFLDGEEGDDYLQGEGGSDVLLGGSGDDTLFGDSDEANLAIAYHGNDVLDGGAGDDILVGQGGSDTLDGGDGADSLYDGEGVAADHQGDDLLEGGAGNDWLSGGAGSPVAQGCGITIDQFPAANEDRFAICAKGTA